MKEKNKPTLPRNILIPDTGEHVRLPSDLFTASGFQKYFANNKELESALTKEFDKRKKAKGKK